MTVEKCRVAASKRQAAGARLLEVAISAIVAAGTTQPGRGPFCSMFMALYTILFVTG